MGCWEWNAWRTRLCFTWRISFERSKLISPAADSFPCLTWRYVTTQAAHSMQVCIRVFFGVRPLKVLFIYSLIGEACCPNGWKKMPFIFITIARLPRRTFAALLTLILSLWLLSKIAVLRSDSFTRSGNNHPSLVNRGDMHMYSNFIAV